MAIPVFVVALIPVIKVMANMPDGKGGVVGISSWCPPVPSLSPVSAVILEGSDRAATLTASAGGPSVSNG